MAGYGWTAYDVRKGGTHVVNDTGNKLDLITHFVKASDDGNYGKWGLRVRARPRADGHDRQRSTVILYLGVEESRSTVECTKEYKTTASKTNVICNGMTTGLGDFKLQFSDKTANDVSHWTSIKSVTVPVDTIWQAKSIWMEQLQDTGSPDGLSADSPGKGNLHFVQKTFEGGCDWDIMFSPGTISEDVAITSLTEDIQDVQSTFDDRFNSAFSPQRPFQDERHITFSQYLLSNLMGGIGYFHGTSIVDTSSAPEYAETDLDFWGKAATARSRAVVQEEGPYQLFTSVPSRPFFPRGFLWDEGFHLQVIMDWDMDLALEIISSWFNLMDDDGWIAREQILGSEARSKVPSEFQTQYPHYANPPTLFLIVQVFVAKLNAITPYAGTPSRLLGDPTAGKSMLAAVYPKLRKHYEWFRRTQAGGNGTLHEHSGSDLNQGYRWRGRIPQHILTSGLDDYPRAQPPHPGELHVDALCWVGTMAMALKEVSAFLGEKADEALFSRHETGVVRSIDSIHWSEAQRAYCDTRVVNDGHVEKICHKGYISLFPFFTKLMSPDHPHLGAVLDLIRDPEELWSPYGLRSLSLKDEFYGTDENYWRSPVWININYMVIQRLLVSTPCNVVQFWGQVI